MINAPMNGVLVYATEVVEKADPPVGVVVATGLILVFGILVLLYLILLLEGRIFKSIDARKAAKQKAAEKVAEAAKPAPPPEPSVQAAVTQVVEPSVVYPPPSPAPAAPALPTVEEGIPPEVVAAITAAVASIEDGKYTLSSVKMIPKSRGQWGLAGVIAHTEPF